MSSSSSSAAAGVAGGSSTGGANSHGEREVKVVLLGESGVGKSSIAARFVTNNFKTITASTIGASFLSKVVLYKGQRYRYNIWDTAGQEKYRSLASMYYKGAECAIIVFDITNRESFVQAEQFWVPELARECGPAISVCVAGNKADSADTREVSEAEGAAFAASKGAMYFETSAKADININELFRDLAGRLYSIDSSRLVSGDLAAATAVRAPSRSATYSLSRAAQEPRRKEGGASLSEYCC